MELEDALDLLKSTVANARDGETIRLPVEALRLVSQELDRLHDFHQWAVQRLNTPSAPLVLRSFHS